PPFLEPLLGPPAPSRLGRPLGLDDDAVSNLRVHLLLLAHVDDLGLGQCQQGRSLQPHRPLVRGRLAHDRALPGAALPRRTAPSGQPASSTPERCSATRESTRTRSRLAPPNGGTAPSSNSG